MPTYQYRCTECGEALEAQQSFTDASLTECPTCQGRLRKVFNAVGVVFKGSGFYRNDSRAADASAKSGSSDSAASTSGGSEPKKADATPAAATSTSGSTSTSSTSEKKPAAAASTS